MTLDNLTTLVGHCAFAPVSSTANPFIFIRMFILHEQYIVYTYYVYGVWLLSKKCIYVLYKSPLVYHQICVSYLPVQCSHSSPVVIVISVWWFGTWTKYTFVITCTVLLSNILTFKQSVPSTGRYSIVGLFIRYLVSGTDFCKCVFPSSI